MLRQTDNFHLKYQIKAQCYVNMQRFGSPTYQRMAEYYGPQYDIQYGFNNQGYGVITDNSQGIGEYSYQGFYGSGSLYIQLPHARMFEPSFNCTRGFRLMNETRTYYDSNSVTTTVYTDAYFDPARVSRQILMGEDQLYPGTCEADIICYIAVGQTDATDGTPCVAGYVCDERTNTTTGQVFLCRAGYACAPGTTPDPSLEAPMGQFRMLCPAGYECPDGTTFANGSNPSTQLTMIVLTSSFFSSNKQRTERCVRKATSVRLGLARPNWASSRMTRRIGMCRHNS